MTAVAELEQVIGALEIPELGHSTVSDHAAVHVLSSDTLAVVVLCGHNAQIIERVIRTGHPGLEVHSERDIITITV